MQGDTVGEDKKAIPDDDPLLIARNSYELVYVCQFLHFFRDVFNLDMSFSTYALEDMLVYDADLERVSSFYMKLLKPLPGWRSLSKDSWIEAVGKEYAKRSLPLPFESSTPEPSFFEMDIKCRIKILYDLCNFHLEDVDYFRMTLLRGRDEECAWRIESIGSDQQNRQYWVMSNGRMYREKLVEKREKKGAKANATASQQKIWELTCKDMADYIEFLENGLSSRPKDRALKTVIQENVLPAITPVLEAQARERKKARPVQLLPRKRSSRIIELESQRIETERLAKEQAKEQMREQARVEKAERMHRLLQQESMLSDLGPQTRISNEEDLSREREMRAELRRLRRERDIEIQLLKESMAEILKVKAAEKELEAARLAEEAAKAPRRSPIKLILKKSSKGRYGSTLIIPCNDDDGNDVDIENVKARQTIIPGQRRSATAKPARPRAKPKSAVPYDAAADAMMMMASSAKKPLHMMQARPPLPLPHNGSNPAMATSQSAIIGGGGHWMPGEQQQHGYQAAVSRPPFPLAPPHVSPSMQYPIMAQHMRPVLPQQHAAAQSLQQQHAAQPKVPINQLGGYPQSMYQMSNIRQQPSPNHHHQQQQQQLPSIPRPQMQQQRDMQPPFPQLAPIHPQRLPAAAMQSSFRLNSSTDPAHNSGMPVIMTASNDGNTTFFHQQHGQQPLPTPQHNMPFHQQQAQALYASMPAQNQPLQQQHLPLQMPRIVSPPLMYPPNSLPQQQQQGMPPPRHQFVSAHPGQYAPPPPPPTQQQFKSSSPVLPAVKEPIHHAKPMISNDGSAVPSHTVTPSAVPTPAPPQHNNELEHPQAAAVTDGTRSHPVQERSKAVLDQSDNPHMGLVNIVNNNTTAQPGEFAARSSTEDEAASFLAQQKAAVEQQSGQQQHGDTSATANEQDTAAVNAIVSIASLLTSSPRTEF